MAENQNDFEVGARLQSFIDSQNLTGKAFAASIQVTQSLVSQICSGKRSLTLQMLFKITGRYPDLNVLWLLFGRGQMLEQGDNPEIQISKPKMTVEDLAHLIILMQARIEFLEQKAKAND